jgi:uncharacterized protein YecT (DUF1311 family)
MLPRLFGIGLTAAFCALGIARADETQQRASLGCRHASILNADYLCSSVRFTDAALELNQVYQALLHQTDISGRTRLSRELEVFISAASHDCNLSVPQTTQESAINCLVEKYRSRREEWLPRLSTDGYEEASRPVEVHLQLQLALREVRFLDPGAAIDGDYGVTTRRAIALYQASEGIGASVPGVLDDRTAEHLLARPNQPINILRVEAELEVDITWPEIPASNGPMRIWIGWNGSAGNCDDCLSIFADGVIDRQASARLDAILRNNDEISALGNYRRTIYLNSPGGNIDAALELGRTIRRWGLNTVVAASLPVDLYEEAAAVHASEQPVNVQRGRLERFHRRLARINREEREGAPQFPVPGICSSACFFAFLGGVGRAVDVQRGVNQLGRIRVHQFAQPGQQTDAQEALIVAQRTTARLANYITQMGADAGSLILGASTPARELRTLTVQEMSRYRITTTRSDYVSDWSIQFLTGNDLAVVADFSLSSRQISHAVICHTNPTGEREVRFAIGLRDPFQRRMQHRAFMMKFSSESPTSQSGPPPRAFLRFLDESTVRKIIDYNIRARRGDFDGLDWPVTEDREFDEAEDALFVDMLNSRSYSYLVFRLPRDSVERIRTGALAGYSYDEMFVTTEFGGGMGGRGPQALRLTGPWHISPRTRIHDIIGVIVTACRQ